MVECLVYYASVCLLVFDSEFAGVLAGKLPQEVACAVAPIKRKVVELERKVGELVGEELERSRKQQKR